MNQKIQGYLEFRSFLFSYGEFDLIPAENIENPRPRSAPGGQPEALPPFELPSPKPTKNPP